MTPEQFALYLENPATLNHDSADELWRLVKEYPYFQAARLLLARNLNDLHHEAYPLSLRLAAAYAGDRSKLKALIEGNFQKPEIVKEVEITVATPVSAEAETQQESEPVEIKTETAIQQVEEIQPVIIEKEQPVEIETVEEETKASGNSYPFVDVLLQRLQQLPGTIQVTETVPQPAEEKEIRKVETTGKTQIDDTQEARNALIDKFIRDEPRISQPKKDFFNPVDVARQSSALPEDLVSETLAKVYEQQGLHQQAIKIYEKLMLLIPEKSSYFAAQIEEINHKRK